MMRAHARAPLAAAWRRQRRAAEYGLRYFRYRHALVTPPHAGRQAE